jgi:uncharacterized protein (DUF342 family)
VDTNRSSGDSVRILSRTFDSWVVEFRVHVEELLDQSRLLHHLREVKQYLASTQSVPECCLAFDGIIRKMSEGETVDVVVRIRKMNIESGAPLVYTTDEVVGADLKYSDMHALLSIFYLDEFEQIVSHDRVMRAIRSAGISMDLVDADFVTAKVAESVTTQSTLKNIPIAHGRLPGIGTDSEIEFYINAIHDTTDVDLLYSTRRIRKGDRICRKTPPSDSAIEGLNVLGQTLPPRTGHDILLSAGANAILSLDGLDIVAECDGIAVISRVTRQLRVGRGHREVPDSVTVKVDPILKISGDQNGEITTNQAVEVIGNLKVGTKILAGGEVFVSGDVEAGVSVNSEEDILIKGEVHGASLSSQKNIVTSNNVTGSELHAHGYVAVAGDIVSSQVDGQSVTARSAKGSRIIARKSVKLQQVDEDENKILTTICVGMHDYFLQRLRENRKFIEAAHSNLERIRLVIGEEIFDQVTESNTHTMLMKFLSRIHLARNTQARKQVDVYRKLIEAIPPTRSMMIQKEKECRDIADRMSEHRESDDGVIIVQEKIRSRLIASVNGVHGVMEKSAGGKTLSLDQGKLNVSSNSDNSIPNNALPFGGSDGKEDKNSIC